MRYIVKTAASIFALWGAAHLADAQTVDESQAGSVGIRKVASRHLLLYTDVPSGAEVDKLPAVFDQSVPQWAEYFGIDSARVANWQARAYLIGAERAHSRRTIRGGLE